MNRIIVQGRYFVPKFNSSYNYTLMALKGILVTQGEAGDIALFSTYGIEDGDFPGGQMLSFAVPENEHSNYAINSISELRKIGRAHV